MAVTEQRLHSAGDREFFCYCCYRVKAFSAPHPPAAEREHRGLGGDTPWIAGPNWSKGCLILYSVMLNFLQLGKKKKGGDVWKDKLGRLSSQVIIKRGGALLCLWELGNEFLVLLVCMTFTFPVKPSISSHNFSHIYSSASPLSHQGRVSEWVSECSA